ncbi:Dot/Icm T4SS effector [Legionella sainthelensi]|uniref:hypothetical protein n=1 Tax=Legionella sainthelensi TaxID=28087 RepID=UPI000F71AA02|nr:hypothetical protein [Legionella sainthelensi]VEB32280.1 Dot/Icm T4SS effector [Legionella sainthelensi]
MKKKKEIALVDIDGCILQDGKLNEDLLKKLIQGNYDQIILFTQRSKFLQVTNLKHHQDSHLKTTEDVATELSRRLDKEVKVSTSVDTMFGAQFNYFDKLKSFERKFLKFMNANEKLITHESHESEIRRIKNRKDLTENDSAKLIAQEQMQLLPEAELQKLKAFKNEIDEEIAAEKKIIRDYTNANPSYRTNDPDSYPKSKVLQFKDLCDELTKEGDEIKVDYYDDSYANLDEIEPDNIPLNRYMVQKGKMTKYEDVKENMHRIRNDIDILIHQYERLVKKFELHLDLTKLYNITEKQIKQMDESAQLLISNLKELYLQSRELQGDKAASNLTDAEIFMKGKFLNMQEQFVKIYIAPVYQFANLATSRWHACEASTSEKSVAFKRQYENTKGDVLKTKILINFKAEIEKCTNLEEIDRYVAKYKKSEEYKTLETGQGLLTRAAHKVGLKEMIRTDSVNAIDEIVKEAKENLPNNTITI